MEIIETIRNYIDSASSITIQKYCCAEMKDFEQFITTSPPWETGTHGYLSPHGLVLRLSNNSRERAGIAKIVNTCFTVKCCPFCGEKIVYKVIEKNM